MKENIGLIYPSDYVYTYANEINLKCFTDSWHCDQGGIPESSWIYNILSQYNTSFWMITPSSDRAGAAYFVSSAGKVSVTSKNDVKVLITTVPSLYLKTDIKTFEGDGSRENPYKLR